MISCRGYVKKLVWRHFEPVFLKKEREINWEPKSVTKCSCESAQLLVEAAPQLQ